MDKLALVGGPEIFKYTVADIMWKEIANVTGVNLNFEVIALNTKQEASKFYQSYLNEDSFIGFNVAFPWKQLFGKYIDRKGSDSSQSIINTVYKREGTVYGANTDPLGIACGLEGYELRNKDILVIGAGGGGQATARHLAQELGAKLYQYDIVDRHLALANCEWLSTLDEVCARKYDLIINATPLGKFYFDRPIEAFCSPIDNITLGKISHRDTILQEMNYLPLRTLFLQLGEARGLRTISGEKMLVFQAFESYKHYFNKEPETEQINMIIRRMQKHIQKQESAILGKAANSI